MRVKAEIWKFLNHLSLKNDLGPPLYPLKENQFLKYLGLRVSICTKLEKSGSQFASEKLSEETFRGIFDKDEGHHKTTQPELNVKQFRVYAAKVSFTKPMK